MLGVGAQAMSLAGTGGEFFLRPAAFFCWIDIFILVQRSLEELHPNGGRAEPTMVDLWPVASCSNTGGGA